MRCGPDALIPSFTASFCALDGPMVPHAGRLQGCNDLRPSHARDIVFNSLTLRTSSSSGSALVLYYTSSRYGFQGYRLYSIESITGPFTIFTAPCKLPVASKAACTFTFCDPPSAPSRRPRMCFPSTVPSHERQRGTTAAAFQPAALVAVAFLKPKPTAITQSPTS
jgi:hypothetical protein